MTDSRCFGIICCMILGMIAVLSLATLTVNFADNRKHAALEQLAPAISHAHEHYAAMLVTTNLVSVPCTCGYCRPAEGVRIPEHIGVVGYDLKVVVSTQYLPIVIRPNMGYHGDNH